MCRCCFSQSLCTLCTPKNGMQTINCYILFDCYLKARERTMSLVFPMKSHRNSRKFLTSAKYNIKYQTIWPNDELSTRFIFSSEWNRVKKRIAYLCQSYTNSWVFDPITIFFGPQLCACVCVCVCVNGDWNNKQKYARNHMNCGILEKTFR